LQAAKPIAQVIANSSCVHRFILSLSWVRNKDRCTGPASRAPAAFLRRSPTRETRK